MAPWHKLKTQSNGQLLPTCLKVLPFSHNQKDPGSFFKYPRIKNQKISSTTSAKQLFALSNKNVNLLSLEPHSRT